MTVTHIVMFGFKPLVSAEEIQKVSRDMLALKDKCTHPQTKKPYIRSASGGTNSSPEGFDRGITHIFVSEFENEEDRDFYLKKDPAHSAFASSLGPVVETIQVLDFTPGEFVHTK